MRTDCKENFVTSPESHGGDNLRRDGETLIEKKLWQGVLGSFASHYIWPGLKDIYLNLYFHLCVFHDLKTLQIVKNHFLVFHVYHSLN